MKRPTKAEQEVVKLRGLITARDILIGELRTHTCLPPEVKEVHVKGDTVYRIPKWYHVVDILVFSTLASLAWHFYSTPRIVEKPYYVTVTKAVPGLAAVPCGSNGGPKDCVDNAENIEKRFEECQSDYIYQRQRIKVLEAWKRNHELQ